jgi:hypothetical protein
VLLEGCNVAFLGMVELELDQSPELDGMENEQGEDRQDNLCRGNYSYPVRFETTTTKAVSARKVHTRIVDVLDGFQARSSSAQGSVAVQLENLAAALEQEPSSQKYVVLGRLAFFLLTRVVFAGSREMDVLLL